MTETFAWETTVVQKLTVAQLGKTIPAYHTVPYPEPDESKGLA